MSKLIFIQEFCELISDDPEFKKYNELLNLLAAHPKKYQQEIDKIISIFEEKGYISKMKSGLIAARKAAKERLRQFEIERNVQLSYIDSSIRKSQKLIQENIHKLEINEFKDIANSNSDEIVKPVVDELNVEYKKSTKYRLRKN